MVKCIFIQAKCLQLHLYHTSNASLDVLFCNKEFDFTGNPFLEANSCAPSPTSMLWGDFSITHLATDRGIATLKKIKNKINDVN